MRIIIAIYISLSIFSSLEAQIVDVNQFFQKADELFQAHVQNGQVDYPSLQNNASFTDLIQFIEQVDLTGQNDELIKAFRINAYNLMVMKQVVDIYPVRSVQEKAGFFDRVKHRFEGKEMTLNVYEKTKMLKFFDDPRFHFVLVCGALGCPPIINEAYTPSNLEKLMDQQTRKALNDPNFLREKEGGAAALSQIFSWYASDFGNSSKNVVSYINQYREKHIQSIDSYYDYDWTLNARELPVITGGSNSANRYVVSAAIPKGTYEFKLFNNLYTQTLGNESNGGSRSTFYTAAISALYGLNNRFNIGLAARYRFVRNDGLPSSPLAAFTFEKSPQNRTGLTALGPQIRWAPFPSLKNFSIQSALTFPIGRELAGSSDKPYIDWNGAVFHTQFFNDFTLSNSFSLFAEVDVLLEDIGFNVENHIFRLSTPVIGILSYFPTPQSTIYAISGFSPYWQQTFDYFYQFGVGSKYQISPQFEVELLYTYFQNKFLLSNDGSAFTYNLGLRYSL